MYSLCLYSIMASPLSENAPSSPEVPGGCQSIDPWPKPIRGPAVQKGDTMRFNAFITKHTGNGDQLRTGVSNMGEVHQGLLILLSAF